METAHRQRGCRGAAALLTASVVAGVALAPAVATADVEVVYDLVASADGVRVSVFARDFLLVADLLDVGLPSAQARTSSSAGSKGFAGNPYPGETAVSAHDLIAGQLQAGTGQDVNLPGYPLYVATDDGAKPEAAIEQPAYSLRSRSDANSSSSSATAGLETEQGSAARLMARAATDADPSADSVTSAAESEIAGLVINDVLRFGRVHSMAAVEVAADGKLRRSSELAVADTTVAGQRVALTPKGLVAAGQEAGVPSSPGGIEDVLQQAGVSVRYLAAERTPTGVVSAGVEITALQKDPTGDSNATYELRYVLGRASASAAANAENLEGGATPGDLAPEPAGSSGPPPTSDSGPAPASGSGPMALEGPAEQGSAAPAQAPPPEVAPAQDSTLAARQVAWPSDFGVAGIYLTMVLVATALFAGGTAVRLLGVRTRWMW